MNIEANSTVSIRYLMRNSRGEVLETIMEEPPITYLHGSGTIMPALEAALLGLKAGDTKTILLSSEQGYTGLDDVFTVEVIIDDVCYTAQKKAAQSNIDCGPDCIC
ncbi:MAG: FKBP-type peptidyl-prolyl cis-trans isomerase [Williamsia sp.]|nr:FKBP-type peptidyl-prolyl cis-trans isomerase [Williamsia sp.]